MLFLKKYLFVLMAIILVLIIPFSAVAASVTPILVEGNDANPNDYTPPIGCVRTTLPNSKTSGTHEYVFDDYGKLSATGTNILTIVVGIAPSTSYTQVLSWEWSGSYEVYAIIVKGGPRFNLYEYNGEFTQDTNLVSPVNASGNPADISHVSVVLCPSETPPPVENCCLIIIILIAIAIVVLIIIMFLIINLTCVVKCRKHHHCHDDC